MVEGPRLLTAKQLASALGIGERSVRTEREAGRLGYVMVAGRYMYPREVIEQFIQQNMVYPCPDQTRDRASSLSKSEAVSTTSVGPKMDAAASKARVAAITTRLKSGSRTGSADTPGPAAPVIQGSFR